MACGKVICTSTWLDALSAFHNVVLFAVPICWSSTVHRNEGNCDDDNDNNDGNSSSSSSNNNNNKQKMVFSVWLEIELYTRRPALLRYVIYTPRVPALSLPILPLPMCTYTHTCTSRRLGIGTLNLFTRAYAYIHTHLHSTNNLLHPPTAIWTYFMRLPLVNVYKMRNRYLSIELRMLWHRHTHTQKEPHMHN